MQVRKQQLELEMEQQTGSKEEKEYVKAVYCHPAYYTRTLCHYNTYFRRPQPRDTPPDSVSNERVRGEAQEAE